MPSKPRNRALYIAAAIAIALLALASRRYSATLPPFVARYAGDTLWAAMAFVATGAVLARASSLWVAVITLAGSYAVEVSQLYHAPWIDGIRHTAIGGLVLGHGFLWTDIACYTVGVVLACALEIAWRGRVARRGRVFRNPENRLT